MPPSWSTSSGPGGNLGADQRKERGHGEPQKSGPGFGSSAHGPAVSLQSSEKSILPGLRPWSRRYSRGSPNGLSGPAVKGDGPASSLTARSSRRDLTRSARRSQTTPAPSATLREHPPPP